jgi:hypothetical protein
MMFTRNTVVPRAEGDVLVVRDSIMIMTTIVLLLSPASLAYHVEAMAVSPLFVTTVEQHQQPGPQLVLASRLYVVHAEPPDPNVR